MSDFHGRMREPGQRPVLRRFPRDRPRPRRRRYFRLRKSLIRKHMQLFWRRRCRFRLLGPSSHGPQLLRRGILGRACTLFRFHMRRRRFRNRQLTFFRPHRLFDWRLCRSPFEAARGSGGVFDLPRIGNPEPRHCPLRFYCHLGLGRQARLGLRAVQHRLEHVPCLERIERRCGRAAVASATWRHFRDSEQHAKGARRDAHGPRWRRDRLMDPWAGRGTDRGDGSPAFGGTRPAFRCDLIVQRCGKMKQRKGRKRPGSSGIRPRTENGGGGLAQTANFRQHPAFLAITRSKY